MRFKKRSLMILKKETLRKLNHTMNRTKMSFLTTETQRWSTLKKELARS